MMDDCEYTTDIYVAKKRTYRRKLFFCSREQKWINRTAFQRRRLNDQISEASAVTAAERALPAAVMRSGVMAHCSNGRGADRSDT
jgi:hypothetical protein